MIRPSVWPLFAPSSPWWKSAPLPSRPGNVLKLLSHERKRPVFSDFHHGLLADVVGVPWAIGAIGVLTMLSGLITAFLLKETLQDAGNRPAQRLMETSATTCLPQPDTWTSQRLATVDRLSPRW